VSFFLCLDLAGLEPALPSHWPGLLPIEIQIHKETGHPEAVGFYSLDRRIRHGPLTSGRHHILMLRKCGVSWCKAAVLTRYSLLAALHIAGLSRLSAKFTRRIRPSKARQN